MERTGSSLSTAIETLPWVDQLCPFMPHQYAVRRRSPLWAWDALDAAIKDSPDNYRAYFRGYRTPNLYWDGPDGLRYWRTRLELNRCHPDSVEPLRRVDEGAGPTLDWDGPPHAPNGIGLYVREPDGRWLPRFEGTEYEPCRGCRRQVVLEQSRRSGMQES